MVDYDWINVQQFYFSHDGYRNSEDVVEEDKEVKALKFEPKVSHEAKIRELLRNIVSSEIKLCSHGVKEFKKCLRGDSGGEFLSHYVRSSSKCSELMEAWRIRQNKPGFIYVVSLITAILDHPDGKYRPDDPGRVQISRALDMFSKSIMEEKLEDLYKELNSKEGKRQKVALLLLAAIVRRGSVLASEVANVFDFKMPMFPKLAEYRRKGVLVKRKVSTRGAFIEFAMSFLEVGQPGLLRWILQQREMFSGVLRGLGNDDDETVVYVLSTLRDRVLISESLLGPGLRSVLFGSITLEQLANISGRENGSLAAEVAYSVLMMVCTNPANGLMPDFSGKMGSLRGNPKRLIDLMKKLKPTDVNYHRELLLAVVCGRPLLASSYLDSFPFNLEDHSSPSWLYAVSLAANLVSSVNANLSWDFLKCREKGPPSLHNQEVQTLLKCVCPRTFSRSAVSKGLQNKACTIQHGTLRFLLEILKLLDAFFNALMKNELSSLKQEIQNEVRNLLPDLQLIFNILNSLGNKYKKPFNSQKPPCPPANSECATVNDNEKLKIDTVEDDDILVGGVSSAEHSLPSEGKKERKVSQLEKSDTENDILKIADLWKMDKCAFTLAGTEDIEVLFHCKLLEVFKICHCALHSVMEVSYDIFKIVPGNLVELPSNLLRSLLPLLLEHIGWLSDFGSCGIIPPIYKHLQSFVNLLLYASNEDIKQQGYLLAQAALLSTGAFDGNPLDVRAWFLFLPGYAGEFVADPNVKLLQKLSQPVISFLCNAVSTVGNHLLKYWDDIKCYTWNCKGHKDEIIYFSPLVVCILEKCLQLLRSDSGTFSVSEKTIISLYVCNTLKYLQETQVEFQFLSSFIHEFLSKEIVGHSSSASDPDNVACEWRPLKDLLLFSEKVSHQELCTSLSAERSFLDASMSITTVLSEVGKLSRDGSDRKRDAVSIAFYSSLLCTNPDQILQNLPSILDISENLYGCHHALITPLLFLDPNLLVSFSRLWPKIFMEGLEMCVLKIKDSQLSSPIKPSNSKFGSAESTSIAFGAFLEHVPFHFLFPPIIISGYGEHHSKVKELLFSKLSKMGFDQLILSLRLVLFWIHQIQLSYREKPSDELQHLSQMCYEILEHIFDRLSALKAGITFLTDKSPSLVSQYLPVVAETIFSHPVVLMSFSSPLEYCNSVTVELPQDSLKGFLCVLGHGVHEMNHHIFNLLSISCDLLLTQCCDPSVLPKNKGYMNKIMKGLDKLVKKIFLLFREKFDQGIRTQDLMILFPVLYGVLSLLQYISPFELLELAHWILYRVSSEEFMSYKTSNISPIYVGFFIAAGAFTMLLDSSLQLPTKEGSFGMLFEGIYKKAVDFSVRFNLHSASLCLVEALNAVCRHKCSQDLIFLSMEMVRVISTTPIQIITQCIHATNGPKSKILTLLIKLSPLHMSIFGHLFLEILEDRNQCLAEKDYITLLPAALTYFSSSITKFGKQYVQKFERFPSCYARILLEGFLKWKSFVSQSILELECGSISISSSEELLKLFSSSLLGNAVLMLKNYFAVRVETKDERLILFDSICSNDVASDGLLDFKIKKIKSYPVNQLLNLINRAVAKITLCQTLLYPDYDQVKLLSEGADDGGMKFLDILVRTWKLIVKKVPSTSDNSEKELNYYCLLKFLEMFILGSLVELAKKMSDVLVQLDSLPFLEKIIRYSLLYRFGDSATFKLIRSTLCSLSKGTLPTDLFLQLLLGHSQLASSVSSMNDSPVCQMAGLFSRPISSILGSLVISSGENSSAGKLKTNVSQLETIKLLRTLYHLSSQKHASFSESGMDINSRELLFLLLSSYGATMSEVDLEIYAFMQDIESTQGLNGCCIAELDFLWGPATIRIRKELEQEQPILMNSDANEMEIDQRKSRFRENLLIDPKFCVATVVNFPYKRTLTEPLLLNESDEDYIHKLNSGNFQQIHCYDPVFILRFSIHCLSMEYLNPVEFAGLGLLAVALVSISSPDEAIRKLGYEVFEKFKDLLEKCPKKKDVMGLKLLLIYVQNRIEDPWKKIPSVHSVFAAEASLVLLDPSHDHYAAISKHLTKTPGVNVKSIPFFDKSSSSIDFKADRHWMLRLLYAGINLEDDAPVFMKKSVLEILLSFYASPLSDTKSKELILQVVKKSVKLKRMAYHLVQDSGLIMWLSSILPRLSLDRDNALYSTKLLVMLLEVAKDAVSFRRNVEWLQLSGFEQFSDLSSRLFRILVSGSNSVQRNPTLVISILEVVMIAMKISMERNIDQPHLTLSFGCSYKLYQAINSFPDGAWSESGLTAILMSAPPVSILHMDYEELSQFLVWATSTALRLDSANTLQCIDFHCYVADLGETCAESFTSKLLRWLVASVILGWISSKRDDLSFAAERTSMDSLLSFMKQFSLENRGAGNVTGSEEVSSLLAAVIFHFQQLLGTKCTVPSSVAAALSILLFPDTSCSNGSELNSFDGKCVSDLWSKIHSPPEVNPAWRWSCFQPWAEDKKSKGTDLERIDELHACEGLIVTISGVLQKKSSDSESQALSLKDLEDSGVFQWERTRFCNRKRRKSMEETCSEPSQSARKLRKTKSKKKHSSGQKKGQLT